MWLNEKELGVWNEEELEVRYFWAVGVTTKALLETVVAMVFLTCTTHDCRSVREYCKRQLKWGRSHMKNVFTDREMQFLRGDPTEEPFGADLNIKLLTKVWTGLGEDVAKKIEELSRLILVAIHDPSRICSREHLWRDLDQLFSKQKELTQCVLRYCHRILEQNLSSLFREKLVLRRGLGVMYKELMSAKESICFAAIDRAVANMESTHQLFTIVEGKVPDLSSSLSVTEMLSNLLEKTNTLDLFGKWLDSYEERVLQLAARIYEIKKLYVNLIDMGSLYDIIQELNYIGGTYVSTHDLREWHQRLINLRQERKERLKVVGRSELCSYSAWSDAFLYDVSRWLLTRRATTLNVEKVYSLIQKSDTKEIITVDNFFSIQIPQVIILSGPVGSGKTCLRRYLFTEWRSGCSPIRHLSEFQLFLSLTSENVRSGSFLHHLRIKILPRALAGLKNSEVIDTLQQLKILFFLDATSGATGGVAAAVEELTTALGRSTMIITIRPEKMKEMLEIFRHLKIKPVVADLLPLEGSQLKNLCLDFIKVLYPPENSTVTDKLLLPYNGKSHNQFQEGSLPLVSSSWDFGQVRVGRGPEGCLHHGYSDKLHVIENSVRRFLEKLLSEQREEEVLYPLPLAYMIMLWVDDPRKLNNVLTLSHLYEEVISFCESELRAKMQKLYVVKKQEIWRRSKETMNKLFNMASRIFTNGDRSNLNLRSETREDLNMSVICSDGLYPFLICFSKTYSHQTKHQHRFLHPSLIDVLHARDIALMLSHKRAKNFCFKPNLPDILPPSQVQRSGNKYLNVLKCLCGFLSRKQPLRATTATCIVNLMKCSGVDLQDYLTWEGFLREGAWSQELKRAIANVLAGRHTWKVPYRRSYQDIRAVSRLVTRGVYLPREVIITSEAPEEVTDMLLSRPDIDVVILPAPGLQSMSKTQQQDALLKTLCKACSVTELWGRLGQEGAVALSSMKRLHTMHVHLSSLRSFSAFSENIKSLLALRTLHIHLDLPVTTPAGTLPPLQCPASATVCLSLYGITDDSWAWSVDVTRSLGRRCQEVNLTQSHLSSPALQQIKDLLHPTPVHVSC